MAVVNAKEAEALMIKAKLQPLEPYTSATAKWKCECLKCGEIVFPQYSLIKSGQGGCRPCGYKKVSKKMKRVHAAGKISYKKSKITEKNALKLIKEHGRIPLEPFISVSKPWLSKCTKCKTVASPSLSRLVYKGTACSTCGRKKTSDAKKLSQIEVKETFKRAGVELLVDYSYVNEQPLKCRCLRCKRIVTPSYANAKKNKEGCKYCAGTFVDPKEAKELMISFGFLPKVKYPGTDSPWKVQHVICGSICHPTYGTIKRGGGGCRNCADWGFSTDKPSYIYLITHKEFKAHKVGIANQPKLAKSDRVHKFKNHGWEVHKIWQFENGYSVLQIEAEVFRIVRKEMKIPQFLSKGQMKYEGETETMNADLITLLELEKIIKKAIKGLQK
jgi:rRNA maturation endonuclease Nob1